MGKRYFFAIVMLVFMTRANAQQTAQSADSLAIREKKWSATLDVLSRYIWRGQAYGGAFPTIQPAVNYAVSDRLTVGLWASTNFQNEYYYTDGISTKGYQEIDLGVSYAVNDFLTVELWDYYWPTFERFEAVDQNYFNYGSDSVKTLDLSVGFDFAEFRYPFNAIISTFIAGNDYKYDENGENPKQNYTTYAELGYTFANVLGAVSKKTFQDISISPLAGVVLNNRAEYYTSADYDKVSLINLSLSADREFDLGNGFLMPVSVAYTHNAATKNTEIDGRDFVVLKVSLSY